MAQPSRTIFDVFWNITQNELNIMLLRHHYWREKFLGSLPNIRPKTVNKFDSIIQIMQP